MEESITELARKFQSDAAIAARNGRIAYRRAVLSGEIRSDAAGVNPDQIPEMKSYLRSQGVDCNFDPRTGEAIFTGRKHRQQVVRAMGMHDRNGGYGDP